jgi:IS30 family transposase
MNYHHITQEERYQIYAYKQTGKLAIEIAELLDRNKSTIYRELSRNSGGRGYQPKQAQELATKRHQSKFKAIKMTAEVVSIIKGKIILDWSPEQISGRAFKDENLQFSISHETIYQYMLADKLSGGLLYRHLRCQKKNKKRYGTKSDDKRGQIKDKISIEKRPQIVEEKSRKGDWEGDLIIGKNHKRALVTLADRKTKKVKIAIVDSKHAEPVSEAVIKLLENETKHTVTFDNGKEFAGHKEIKEKTGAMIYFAHPYSSWERGLNENTNGLIRQYFPKGSSFESITNADVKRVENILNNRPRKTLGFCTPNEIYDGTRRVRYQ